MGDPTGGQPGAAVRRDLLAVLRRPQTIRARCAAITRAVADDRSSWFSLQRTQLAEAAGRVVSLIQRRYPDLKVPPHGSRWRGIEAGGVDRMAVLEAALAGLSPDDRARAQVDLAVVGVLLGAGAGSQWRYVERSAELPAAALPVERVERDDLLAALDRASRPAVEPPAAPQAAAAADGSRLTGSEGLAVATLRAFLSGVFSAERTQPCRVDASALRQIDAAVLRAVYQSAPSNPLPALEGRAALLVRLGEALAAASARDGLPARPSLLFDRLIAGVPRAAVTAGDLLLQVLQTLEPVWTSGSVVMGVRAGDIWPHRWAGAETGDGEDAVSSGWVPLHQTGQWLCYALVEPLQRAGVQFDGVEALTGLPDDRSGGLLIDTGVLVPRSPRSLERLWKPGDEFVVEWRALTVTLLDELAALVRRQLDADAARLPLACIVEAGTRVAGRDMAAERRGGAPPVRVDGDGALF